MLANSRVLSQDFELITPQSLDEVLSMLADSGQDASLLFGGTDLLVQMKMGKKNPGRVINCQWLPELRGVRATESTFDIGAGTPLEVVASHAALTREFPALNEAILSIAGPAIRRMGTIGGNVVNASPAADSVVALVAHRAQFRLESRQGERLVPADQFFVGPGLTVKRPDEVLTQVILPRYKGSRSVGHFRKVGRVAGDIAKLSVVVSVQRSDLGAATWQVAMGSVAPTPLILLEVEQVLNRTARMAQRAGADIRHMVESSIHPIDDVRSTAWYRRRVSGVIVSDLWRQVWEEFEGAR